MSTINHMTQKRKTRFSEYSAIVPLVAAEEIQKVFEHWINTFFSASSGKKPKLTPSREAHIAFALYHYSLEQCFAAITGCAASEWHMGANPNEKIYNSLELIFRNEKHTNRFIWLNSR